LFLSLSFCVVKAQTNFQTEYQFLNYLINNHQLKESEIEFSKLDFSKLNSIQTDSINYLWGWKNYSAKELETACLRWQKVSNQSVFYTKSKIFTAYNYAFLRKYNLADSLLQTMLHDTIKLNVATAQFEISCINLLINNFKMFDSITKITDTTFYQLKQYQTEILQLRNDKSKLKMRSPFVAGTLSAIVPGLGKIYAHKPKQGIALMLPMLMFGSVAFELYKKDGVQSASFISAASIYALFYIGNIVGSVYSTKISYNQKIDAIENKILFNMHIPLRNIYN
jgi:TM2 domain-containing membrane protein YozV